MECMYTCFDRVMHLVKPAGEERQLRDLVCLIQYDGPPVPRRLTADNMSCKHLHMAVLII